MYYLLLVIVRLPDFYMFHSPFPKSRFQHELAIKLIKQINYKYLINNVMNEVINF